MTKQLHIMVGAPGSGKSTFVQRQIKLFEEEQYTTAVISRDSIRFSMFEGGGSYFSREKEVFKEFIRQINECMEVGVDIVYVDATHVNEASRRKLLRQLLLDPNTLVVFDVMDVSIDECISRNNLRKGCERVPEQAIQRMAESFTLPTKKELIKLGLFNDCQIKIYN